MSFSIYLWPSIDICVISKIINYVVFPFNRKNDISQQPVDPTTQYDYNEFMN